jgi:hypothetical protein
MKSVQIDLHHSEAATAVLCQKLAEGMTGVSLIHEPCIYRGQIRGITKPGGTIFSVAPEGKARPSIYIRNHINALPLVKFSSRDTTRVRVESQTVFIDEVLPGDH